MPKKSSSRSHTRSDKQYITDGRKVDFSTIAVINAYQNIPETSTTYRSSIRFKREKRSTAKSEKGLERAARKLLSSIPDADFAVATIHRRSLSYNGAFTYHEGGKIAYHREEQP